MYKKIRISRTETRDEHRLVMEKFLGRRLLSHEIVHHIDGDPENNDIANLELTNRSEHARMHQTGVSVSTQTRRRISASLKGTKSPLRKLTMKQVQEIRASNLPQRMLARLYNVGKTTIQAIQAGQIYTSS